MEPNEPEEAKPELTDEQRQAMYDWINAHPYGDQDENGIDLSLLRENLKLTPTERYRNHQRALKRVQEVRNAGIRARVR